MPFRRRRLPEQNLLHSLIPSRRKPKIACIGTFGNPRSDPSLAFFMHHTPSKSVTAVDCIDSELKRRLVQKIPGLAAKATASRSRRAGPPSAIVQKVNALKTGGRLFGTAGGMLNLRRRVRHLQVEAGLESKGVRLQPGLAWNTGLKPKSLDLLVDRDTMHWVSKQKPGAIAQTVNHYLSLLRKNGKIVFLVSTGLEGHATAASPLRAAYQEITDILGPMVKAGGIRIEEVDITNSNFRLGKKVIEPHYRMGAAIIMTKL